MSPVIIAMKRFRIAGPKETVQKLVQHLHEFGSFHVTPPQQDSVLRESGLITGVISKEIAEKLAETESLLNDLQTALSVLPEDHPEKNHPDNIKPADRDWLSCESTLMLRSAASEILNLSRRIDGSREELKEVVKYRKMFEEYLPLIEMVASSSNVELVGVTFATHIENAFNHLEAELEKVTEGAFTIFKSTEHKEGKSGLVVYPSSLAEKVMRHVIGKKARPVHLPDKYGGKTFANTLKQLFQRENDLRRDLAELEAQLKVLSDKWSENLLSAIKTLNKKTAPLRTQKLLAHSENAFWLSGWVPEIESERLTKKIEEEFQGQVLVYALSPSPKEFEETPVQLKNVFWAKPFEKILDTYSLPQYGTVDPTMIMAVTFPLFFGLILGDVGYAVILAGLGYLLKRIFPHADIAKDAARIISLCAISSAIFGVVYGELFGKLWQEIGLPHPLFDRKEEMIHMFYLVLFLGCAHTLLGVFLGAYNGFKLGSTRTAMEKTGDAGILLSLLWIIFLIKGGQQVDWEVMVPAGFFLLKLASGDMMEVVTELPKIFSNVLSYSRLMALGAASIIMADLADDILLSGTWIVLAVLGSLTVHLINFIIGVFSPAIQSGRLHFVEFFSQFYIPKGKPFAPLK